MGVHQHGGTPRRLRIDLGERGDVECVQVFAWRADVAAVARLWSTEGPLWGYSMLVLGAILGARIAKS